MFFCCEEQTKTDKAVSKYAVEMIQTPQSASIISQQKQVILHADKRYQRTRQNRYAFNKNPRQRFLVFNPEKNIKTQENIGSDFIRDTHKQILKNCVLKKVMKSPYQKLIRQYEGTTKKWTDPDFPPNQKSFGQSRHFQNVVWKRATQIIKGPMLISDKIKPSDILQGAIGDCYFLSAIAGIAQKQQRIRSIFGSLEINKNGIYMAKILDNGVYKEIVVDDYFPCDKHGRPRAATPSGGIQIWVMILQKCWAKLHGSYEIIQGGLCNQVLHAFTAAPTFQYLTNQGSEQEQDELFYKIIDANAKDYVICCGTRSGQGVQQMGLVEGHAYTILQAFNKPKKMLKIRNPWGQKQWIGPASEKDRAFWKKITNSQKNNLEYIQKDDGIFFMFWEDFLEYFFIVDIAKISDESSYNYEEVRYPKYKQQVNLLKTKGGAATISLTQQNVRGQKAMNPKYARTTIILAKKLKKGEYQYILSSSEKCNPDTNMEISYLDPGDYIIISNLSGRNLNEEKGVISCYGDTYMDIDPYQLKDVDEFLHQVFLDHARKNKQNQQRIFGPRIDVWVCMDILYESGFAYTVVHVGKSSKVKLGLTFDEEQYIDSYFDLLPPNKGSGSFKIVCEGGQESIVLCRIVPQNFSVSSSMPIPSIKRLS